MKSIDTINDQIQAIFKKHGIRGVRGPEAFYEAVTKIGQRSYADATKLRRLSREWEKAFREQNPADTERQRRFMCAEYGRKKRGEKTRTGMTRTQLREYCSLPVQENPHLSAKWDFVGMFPREIIGRARKLLKAHGFKMKVTRDLYTHDPKYRELYVGKGQFRQVYTLLTGIFGTEVR